MFIIDNPEFVRLRRIKLRPRSMILLGVVSLGIFGSMLALFQFGNRAAPTPLMPQYFFFTAIGFQLGLGALYALMLSSQNITLERERNTYDFQRMVAIGPWRLGVGKLFGSACEAAYGMLGGVLFTLYPVLTGHVSILIWLKAQIVAYVFALLVTSFGLMCSSMVAKTSYSTGMMLLFIVFAVPMMIAAVKWGGSVWSAASPIRMYYELYSECNPSLYTPTRIGFFGSSFLSMFEAFLLINCAGIALFFVLAVRRMTDEELSIIRPRHGVIAFALLQTLLIGSCWDMYSFPSMKAESLMIYHIVNATVLMFLAFGLTPTAELLRGRLSRGRRNEHWKIFFELRNRLEDSPAISSVALFALAYAVLAGILTYELQIITLQSVLIIAMVVGMAIATASMLLYISVYTERGALKIGALIVVLALTIPPMIVGPLWQEKVFSINPYAYMAAFGNDPEFIHSVRIGKEISPIACPILCVSLGVLLSLLAAMRIRFLLDLDEMQRQKEQGDVAKPSNEKVSAARAMLAKKEESDLPAEIKPDAN